MKIIVAALLLIGLLQTTKLTNFDCVITNVDKRTIDTICDSGINGVETEQKLHQFIPIEDWNKFPEWKNNRIIVGEILKAKWDQNGNFQSVKPCWQRIKEMKEKICAGLDCRPPNSIYSQEGCGVQPSKFIQDLLDNLKNNE